MRSKKLLLSLSLLSSALMAHTDPVEGLYSGLSPNSITEHLALHKLYPDTETGQKALKHVEELLQKAQSEKGDFKALPTNMLSLDGFISFMLGQSTQKDYLEEAHLEAIEQISAHLPNRKLKGHQVRSEEEVKALKPEEIDLARALLIAQQRGQEIDWQWIRNYEAQIDFMALQILARLPKDPTPKQIIKEINQLVFFEMRYRFPALSALKTGDEPFSRLTTVMDSKHGVCLGISVLYLCLSQRLDLPLEIVIPPGHIFVRYMTESGPINIETTARGIDYPSDNYLDVNTKYLREANLKEVIGFVFYNVSSSYLINLKDYPKAIENYLHSLEYAPDNEQTYELLGYAYYLNRQEKEAKLWLQKLKKTELKDRIASNYLDAHLDILKGKVSPEAIEVLFKQHKETHEGLLAKRDDLIKLVEKYPHFKAARFFLAETYQQLSQYKKSIEHLEKIHKESESYPFVELTLSNLYLAEYNFAKAWEHFKHLEQRLSKENHYPKMMKEYKQMLKQYSLEI